MGVKTRKKLIEVALPLDAINKASAREKSIRHGHPSTLHLWWARRPLAAARAVIFSQMVDDPSEYVDTLKMDDKLRRRAENELKKRHKVWEEISATKEKAEAHGIESPDPGPEPTLDEIIAEQERDRLFKIIEELVLWENTTNETVLEKARAEIWQSWRRTCADNVDHPRAKELFDRNKLPAFHDPFAGGGALPLEAQRLGLEAYASDLNPVAVLINKALIEIPPKFAGMPPVNPEWQSKSDAEKALRVWKGAEGLAEDVRYYGKWMRDEAEKRIGHLYPKVEVTEEMAKERPDLKQYVGKKLTAIAWLWARTAECPNPGCKRRMPLLSSFVLSSKERKEAYLAPVVDGPSIRFEISNRPLSSKVEAKEGYKRGMSGIFECAFCGTVTSRDYVAEQAVSYGLDSLQTAVVVEADSGRQYLVAQEVPDGLQPVDTSGLDIELSPNPRDVWCRNFGLLRPTDLFSKRQLVMMTTLSDLIAEIRDQVSGSTDDRYSDYADAIGVYLAFLVDQVANHSSSLCGWNSANAQMRSVFARQALPMVWDYAESNPFCDSSGSFNNLFERLIKGFGALGDGIPGHAVQLDAGNQETSSSKVISTDPPYYDNIGYADLSDFFYVWLRRSLRSTYPELFSTLTVPKSTELISASYRHGSKAKSESFFLEGMTRAMKRLAEQAHSGFPVTIYYAFKQSESKSDTGTASTGWETFLGAVISAGFAITGTWPVRTEKQGRVISYDTNALASSIILVCRSREVGSKVVTRREFVNALKSELPEALRHLQRGNIAPVDLAQAAIGPGMAVFTRYERVLDAEGNKLSVREALALINQTLDEVLAEQEGDFDADTRWALTWFEENGFDSGEFGRAEQLSKAKNTSISEMADPKTSPILEAKGGNVRLFRPAELEEDWSPDTDGRLTVWDMVHQLIRVLEKDGETAAASIAKKLGANAETARELCYRLYTICERKKRPNDALSYNALVQSWPEIVRLAAEQATSTGGEKQILPGM